MIGNKGLAIAITALLLTVCLGYLFNASETTTTATTYNTQADMGAVFYENSSRGSGTEVYNAPANVTGWTPTEIISTVSTPNQYLIDQGEITYGDVTSAQRRIDSSSVTPVTTTQGVSGGTWYYSTTVNGVYYYGGETTSDGKSLHGGTSYTYGNYALTYELNGTAIDNGEEFAWFNLYEMWQYGHLDYLYLSEGHSGSTYYTDVSIEVSGALGDGGVVVNFEGTAATADHAIYNIATDTWALYDSDDNKLGSASNIYVTTNDSSVYCQYTYKECESATNATYADPTKLADMSTSTTAAWSSGGLIYSSITLLITNPTDNTDIVIVGTSTDDNDVEYTHTLATVYNTDSVLKVDDTVIGSTSAYAGVLITFDMVNHVMTVQGVLTMDATAPRTNYTVASNYFTLAMTSTSSAYSNLIGLSFSNEDETVMGASAAIVSSEVYVDPKGVLWNDFNVNINSYYPAYISADNLGVRVLLGGFVTYGDSLTVNGQTFAVTDGTIEVDLTDGVTTQTRTMKLSGMAIDYREDGHAYLVFTESLNRESDLGAVSDYVIAGAGAWYFSATLQTIEETTTEVWEWVTDWSLDTNATCALYLALTIAGLVLGLYFGRGAFDIYDWAVLILADIIAFSLMVV